VIDIALKLIEPLLQLLLTNVFLMFELLTASIHHFCVGQRPGLRRFSHQFGESVGLIDWWVTPMSFASLRHDVVASSKYWLTPLFGELTGHPFQLSSRMASSLVR
jgi:hypothetical protein